MGKPTVELWPAHGWTCESCGRDNFCRGEIAEFNEEERRDFWEQHGEFPETGFWMTAPSEVKCANCGAEFATVDSRSEE